MKYIINGRIILKTSVLEGKALVYDSKIIDIIDNDKVPAGADIIDAKGNYVSPGLIDIHMHGYLGDEACDDDKEVMRRMSAGIVKNGVTGWLPTTMTVARNKIENAFKFARELKEESKTWMGSAILGVNSEGPFINAKRKGAQAEEYILKPDASLVKEYADVVKIITMSPETDEDFAEIKKIANETDVVVSIGHSDADYETAIAAFDCGVKHVTHLFNAQTPLNHRKPGIVGAALSRKDITTELICDTFHIHKGLFQLVADCKQDKLILITDCVRAGGLSDGEYTLGGQKIFVNGIECLMEDGTIAGSVLTLNKAVYNFFSNTDWPIYKVVYAASMAPAQVINVDDKKGSIEIGKDADIIIADDNFNIIKTIIGGTVRYEA
ncbi:N-acetylglucosamine-6-phosphate deacetylase [Eubacteriales bacterium OttesenSCG-928-G02]|nr:N-acetylglucosamine-6-phosphate deacetylase [Eubacteriales bacterium OttesenSCG-928-G02]